jgi:hypothetical protein
MKKGFYNLLPLMLVVIASNQVLSQTKSTASSNSYFTMENYYKIKWGHADEFIDLWKKNHYPLLKKTIENGDIITVKAEKPILHSGEDTRWDFKVTIVFKNAELGVGKDDPTLRYRAQLYPDLPKLKKDEEYRFSLLIAHWDVIVENVPVD